MEWRLPDYAKYDLSSLRFAIYGGQAVPRQFLERMKAMAPRIGTGLGLTETAGFCTYTNVDADVDELAQGIGYDSPLCPISIRDFMKPDGTAGAEKPKGEVGEICFSGPQVFLGYLGDPENTAKTVSKEGICYTGDVGYYDEKGLHFSGRAKLIIKPKGYQVFPEDVERHIHGKLKDRAAMVAVVGVEHEVFSEGIMAFVECLDGRTITPEEVMAACERHLRLFPPLPRGDPQGGRDPAQPRREDRLPEPPGAGRRRRRGAPRPRQVGPGVISIPVRGCAGRAPGRSGRSARGRPP